MVKLTLNEPVDREPVVAGKFYAAAKDTLINDVSGLFTDCKKPSGSQITRALMSPHAGYVFSGKIAASAYSAIDANTVYENIFIIGSSHVMRFNGASVYDIGDYNSPLDNFPVNKDIAHNLRKADAVFDFPATSHVNEHSLEVQLPFIWYKFKTLPPIVPIIIGTDEVRTVRKIADTLRPWFIRENLFIISTDFSHYPPYKDAIENDKRVALSIESGDPEKFLRILKQNSMKKIRGLATSMCGWTSGLVLMYLAENSDQLEFQLIDYCNSGDSIYGGKDKVVGYYAIALVEK
jgi:MEMO1 family protein